MKLKVKNGELKPYMDFLQNLKLKSRASRGRTKLVKLLDERQYEYNKDLLELQKEYFKQDDDGNLIAENNHYVFKDPTKEPEAQAEMEKVQNEYTYIDVSDYPEQIKALYNALDTYDEDLEGVQATIYDTLMDQLDRVKEDTPDVKE